jgi:hypothetical protein
MLCQAGQKVLGYIEENERKTLFRIMRGKWDPQRTLF